MISVSINGATHQFSGPISLAMLIGELQLEGKRIALEQNGAIVPQSCFPTQCIANGDRLEIVVAVGGG